MAKVCILGGGSWGIGLSVVLHKNGHEVTVWSAVPAEIQMLQENHEHKMLPGVKLPEDLRAGRRIDTALGDAESRGTLPGETSLDIFIDRGSHP